MSTIEFEIVPPDGDPIVEHLRRQKVRICAAHREMMIDIRGLSAAPARGAR